MDTLDGMRTFTAVVSEGSFAGAAERLDMSPQLVSKYVGQLERRLGARLLNRSTRRVSITEAGQAYVERCKQVLADIDEMESAVGDSTMTAHGTLRINAPMSFGITHLARAIAGYLAEQPQVEVDLTLNDRVVDLVGEGYDLGIRISQLADSSLVARRIAPVRLAVCASPGYLEKFGVPESPDDLLAHNCLGYAYWAERGNWRFEHDGKPYVVPVSGRMAANNGDALREAAISDAGVILQPTFIVGEDIRAGRLQRLLPDYALPELGVYAVYAHRQFLSAKVRTIVDFLSDYFGSTPYWDA